MTTTVSGDTGVSQCQPDSVSQDDLKSGVAGRGPIFKGTLSSLNTTGSSIQYADLTQVVNTGFTKSGAVLTPTVAGWYIATLSALGIGATTALGLVIQSTTNGDQLQAQPPYASNSAYLSIAVLTYCNGTTDNIKFGIFGTVAGCAFTGLIGCATLVRAG